MENKTESFSEQLTNIRKKVPQSYPQYMEYGGKLQPQSLEIEEAVLGALMLESDAISKVLDIIDSYIFYKEEHKLIFEAIKSLFQKTIPIDILTVTSELRLMGKLDAIGGPFYISELTNRVGSSANIEYHSRLLIEKYILRELIRISQVIQSDAFEDTTDPFDLLDKAERELFRISEGLLKNDYSPMSSLISSTLQNIEKLTKDPDKKHLKSVFSGFTELDKVTGGWQPSDLIIMASRPGMGKTSFVLSIARNVAVDFEKPVAVFSLEMSAEQLVQRLLSAEAEIDSRKLKTGDLADHEWQQLNTKINKLSNAQIFIDDTASINVFELRAKCRRLKNQYNIGLVIIDYLQLMNAHVDNRKNVNREQEISNISRSLKGMAKELNIPVIALSQLSREVEKRGTSRKPILSDLRESGSIEQDSDQVIFIYRPEYYNLDQDEAGNPTKGVAEIIIAKNRHGATKTVELRFIDKFTKFANVEDYNLSGSGANITLESKMNSLEDDDNELMPF